MKRTGREYVKSRSTRETFLSKSIYRSLDGASAKNSSSSRAENK